jgi:tetratricopeptide (TPR) repeat protein
MADACLRQGDLETALRYIDDARNRAATPGERASALYVAAWAAGEQGENSRERELLVEALFDAEQAGGGVLERVLSGLAWNAMSAGDVDAAMAYADRAKAVALDVGNPARIARVLSMLTAVTNVGGDWDTSVGYAFESLDLALDAGDLEGAAIAQTNLGVAHHLRGDSTGSRELYVRALRYYEEAQTLNRRLGRRSGVALGAANIAQIHIRLGDDEATRRHLHDALTLSRATGSIMNVLFCVLAEADRRLTLGDAADAAGALELIGLVQRHPAYTDSERQEIERILGRTGLAPDEIERGVAAHDGEDFDATVERITEELAGS